MSDFERRINSLDIGLFDKIPSQSTDHDRATLLACQLAVRELRPGYKYLEIGSYLGGSIQPHLLDDKCGTIYSVDKRPEVQPDARGYDWVYQNNSTARMLELLKGVAENTDRITTLDGDTESIKPDQIVDKIDLCFIDGEHTDEAVLRDFKFCLDVLNENGAIMFHDSQITYNGIAASIKYLEGRGIKFHGYILPNLVFVIEIGDFPLHRHPRILERLVDNHNAYIYSLQDVDKYRRFATRFPFGFMRRALIKIRRTNVSQ
jgi:predicted O-methyltransferase YrrM